MKNNTISQKITDAQRNQKIEAAKNNREAMSQRIADSANKKLHGSIPQAIHQITPEEFQQNADEMTTVDKIADAANRHLANQKLHERRN